AIRAPVARGRPDLPGGALRGRRDPRERPAPPRPGRSRAPGLPRGGPVRLAPHGGPPAPRPHPVGSPVRRFARPGAGYGSGRTPSAIQPLGLLPRTVGHAPVRRFDPPRRPRLVSAPGLLRQSGFLMRPEADRKARAPRLGRLLTAALLSLSAIVASQQVSVARPSHADLQAAKARLSTLNNHLDILVEQYDQARVSL